VQFEWDERKRRLNIKRHGIDFLDALEIFQGPMLVNLDEADDYGKITISGWGYFEIRRSWWSSLKGIQKP
jgi:hypothetical protein